MTKWSLILVTFVFCSCNNFKSEENSVAVARVGDSYLYREELDSLVPYGTSKEDSLVIIRSYIDRWAAQELLIDAAEVNLANETKAEFDQMLKQYKIDLYTKAYIEKIVNQSVDTIVTEAELKSYYEDNASNFRTNETLVRLRYINLKRDNPRYESIKQKFYDYRKSDKKFWDTYVLQFKSFALNDSVWVDLNQVYNKLPFINPDNVNQYISSGKTIEHTDKQDVFLVKINRVIDKDEVGSFEYLRPTLVEVILNKRKLALIKKFEKEITHDAIKEKKYEIYK